MKDLLSKHLFNRPYSELPLASEIYVDLVKEKTMWQVMSGVLAIGMMVWVAKTLM